MKKIAMLLPSQDEADLMVTAFEQQGQLRNYELYWYQSETTLLWTQRQFQRFDMVVIFLPLNITDGNRVDTFLDKFRNDFDIPIMLLTFRSEVNPFLLELVGRHNIEGITTIPFDPEQLISKIRILLWKDTVKKNEKAELRDMDIRFGPI